ncbi:MAG: M42 family peptidase, partial [Chitinophagaceae bacterium]
MAKEKKEKASEKAKQKPKKCLNKQSYDFLRNYINTTSPVGFETSGQKVWLNYIKQYVDTTFTDPYGTAVGVINPDAPFKVVIEAHADEISWFVNYITNDG